MYTRYLPILFSNYCTSIGMNVQPASKLKPMLFKCLTSIHSRTWASISKPVCPHFKMEIPSDLGEETLAKTWEEWKVKFGKKYKDETEESYRKGLFCENLKRMKEHNEKYDKGLVTFTMGINQFSANAKGEDPCGHHSHGSDKKCSK